MTYNMSYSPQMDEEFSRGNNTAEQDDEYFGYSRELEKEAQRKPTQVSKYY